MDSEKIYYALVNFMAKQTGWLTIKAENEENARETLLKEFVGTEGIKEFEITEIRDVPPIMDIPNLPSEDDLEDTTITEDKKETVH